MLPPPGEGRPTFAIGICPGRTVSSTHEAPYKHKSRHKVPFHQIISLTGHCMRIPDSGRIHNTNMTIHQTERSLLGDVARPGEKSARYNANSIDGRPGESVLSSKTGSVLQLLQGHVGGWTRLLSVIPNMIYPDWR